MKNMKRTFIAFLLCASIVASQFQVLATGLFGDTDLSEEDEPESGFHGSGSYQLNEIPDDYRFYTEYYVDAAPGKSFKTAAVERRTTIKVYAQVGEVILFGSSVANSEIDEKNVWTKKVTGKDIVITTPSGKKVTKDVLLPTESQNKLGVGYIANPTQEKNGPMVNHTDQVDATGKYYVPLKHEVEETGVYVFEFHSVKGYNDGSVPSPKLAKDKNWQQGTTTVAAWDVTVLGEDLAGKWEVKEGRAWADYLALSTGDADKKKSDLNVHVLTHDGYVYKVDFQEAVPYGFIFFANNTGFMTSVKDENGKKSYRPIYHSFYDSTNDLDHMTDGENIYLHKPNDPDTSTQETYKIFFNAPSEDLNAIDIKTQPETNVVLSELKFGGIGDNLARAGHGGYFTFNASGEAMVTIRLDLRKAILESENTMDSYEGSGIVEITAPAVAGSNSFYWDGKDTDGIVLPAGIYGNNNVVLSSEVKRGELHFPVIDMEGLFGGLHVERLNGNDIDSDNRFNLYYNNNPLAYGTIEGKEFKRETVSNYDILTDGTKSYKISNEKGGITFFQNYPNSITTIVKDTKEYLSMKLFDSSYNDLSSDRKAIIDAEFGKEQDTFHYEAVDSRNTSMQFDSKGYNGGGNQAGIDAWTYYTQGVKSDLISFALMDTDDRGLVRGQIFYDVNKDSQYNQADGDYLLPNMKVRLVDSTGKALVHKEMLPCFDKTGHFVYDNDGTVKHELRSVKYETVTDSSGYYRFTGVPYNNSEDTKYYVQVLLSDVQSEVMRYTCTTSEKVKEKLKTNNNTYFLNDTIDLSIYGSDGNTIVKTNDVSKIYGYKYDRDSISKDTVFDKENAQTVSFSASSSIENGIRVEDFKRIGYSSTVPGDNLKDYTVKKIWGTDSQGNATHQISDGLIIELWVWNDSAVSEENTLELSRRTGALVDTQVLSEENDWTYTWKNLDDRLQYYVLEYYTKKKPNGEIIYNDKHEPRKVLIGGTMPIFSTVPVDNTGIYGFETNLGDYPETIQDPNDAGKTRIPIQKFNAPGLNIHANSITRKEKLESVDNNARQYDVTYKLYESGNTNVIELMNSQLFDDRSYYVWLGHQTVLPDMIAQTFVEDGNRKGHALVLEKDKLVSNGEYTIKGLSVSSVDAAEVDNVEGNATNAFRIKESGKSALFTATSQGNYKTGTGTRTYQVKYVVNQNKEPVSVIPNESGELVLSTDKNTKVESNDNYIVYTWYMTIHVYDVVSDGVFEYDINGDTVKLQDSLGKGNELTWTLSHDSVNNNSISYTNDDERKSGILQNDTYRLPLYKAAENPHMGSCADLVGIAYAGSTTVDDISELVFEDTYESRYGTLHNNEDGTAVVNGSGGYVTATLNTPRNTRINRIQDHANYADISFTPSVNAKTKTSELSEDVFYYKIIVFAEDNTYQYNDYDDIDASDGVVMYTYFTMKPKQEESGEEPEEPTTEDTTEEEPTTDELTEETTTEDMTEESTEETTTIETTTEEDVNPSVSTTENQEKEPEAGDIKTGDNSPLLMWFGLVFSSAGLSVLVTYLFKKRSIK